MILNCNIESYVDENTQHSNKFSPDAVINQLELSGNATLMLYVPVIKKLR